MPQKAHSTFIVRGGGKPARTIPPSPVVSSARAMSRRAEYRSASGPPAK